MQLLDIGYVPKSHTAKGDIYHIFPPIAEYILKINMIHSRNRTYGFKSSHNVNSGSSMILLDL